MFLIKFNVLCLLIINCTRLCAGNTTIAAEDNDYDDDYSETDPTPIEEKVVKPVQVNYDSDEKEVNLVLQNEIDLLSNTFKKTIQKIKEKYKKVDILFLIDASSSVGKVNFLNEINFAKRLLSDFNVSYNYTRTSLISFSSKGKIIQHINQISQPLIENDKCMLLNYQIPEIEFSGGGTYTYGAFLEAQKVFSTAYRNDSKKIIFLITDGYSNGKKPVTIANELKAQNITIFAIGISSGNADELKSIASLPSENYNYMLNSFSNFESLARKALHADYKTGVIVPVNNQSLCNILCKPEEVNKTTGSCCDSENAECACGYYSGHYSCICKAGYYGTGLQNSCEICPNGTYWSELSSCIQCPDVNHETLVVPALNISGCTCKNGFKENDLARCESVRCPELKPPENGYFVKHEMSSCGQILNTACGARCKSGFQLTGSSIRYCKEDGSWSGNETECVLKTCPALQIPFYGISICKNVDLNVYFDYSPRNATFMLNYSQEVEKFTEDLPIDTDCSFKCAQGFYLVGSEKRNCLPVSKWDGLNANCKQVLCPPLPKIPFATYDPVDCSDSKMPHSTNCTIDCEEGFELKGPAMKSCTGTRNGAWSQKGKVPRCLDILPPAIECPQNYTVELHSNSSFILLSEVAGPANVSDNSNLNVTFWVKPALKEEGTKLYLGNYTFTYVAVDDFKNKARCNFSISVVDKTPPEIENCLPQQTFYVPKKVNNSVIIEWEEPMAFDNLDDENVTTYKSMNFSQLDVGAYQVNYTFGDMSGNYNQCLVEVIVKEKKCDYLEKPVNGQSFCAKNSTYTWCDILCNFGYGLISPNTVLILENVMFHCDNENRTWDLENFPECVVIEKPTSVQEIMTISLQTESIDCQNFTDNQEEYLKTLKEDLCIGQEDNDDCEVTAGLPNCENEDANLNEISQQDKNLYNIVKREISSPLSNESSLSQSSSKQKPKNMLKVNLYIKLSKRLGLWKSNGTRSDNIKQVKEELKNLNSNEKLKKRLKNIDIDLSYLKLDELIKCNKGSIAKNLVCAQCPRGSFHDIKQSTCESCPFGSYNNLTGQTTCKACPENFSTRKIHSKSESECRQKCLPGSIARIKVSKNKRGNEGLVKSLMPFCRLCNIGEYQPLYDQTECKKCPVGYNSLRGSKSPDDCFVKVDKPCQSKPCGLNGKCVPDKSLFHCDCSEGFTGSRCEIEQECMSAPCFNGGLCSYVNQTIVRCECPYGFQGEFCEQAIDPCDSFLCENGGTCVEQNNELICECPSGYEGESCEKISDNCLSSPCVNGECRNTADGYSCDCSAGSMGKRCHLTPCDFLPCHEKAICSIKHEILTTKNSFYCRCPKGLRGPKCDQINNPCDRRPCKDNAKCHPMLLRTPGFRQNVDDDKIFEKFECTCPPFFYGELCDRFSKPDFVLEFDKSNINNYVKMPGPAFDLQEISFCSWIKTTDTFNYGSLISYASKDSDNVFTFTDYNGFVLYINDEKIITDLKVNDGIWHFICVSWASAAGSYEIYSDGILFLQGKSLSASKKISGNGIFVIGQEQDTLGGSFSESESFIGNITYFDIWNRTLSDVEVYEMYRTCEPYQGNLYDWTDLKFKVHGNVKILRSDFCRSCEKGLHVSNGLVEYQDQDAFIKCVEGYKLEGSPIVKCLRTSQWEQKLPVCKLIRCGSPTTPLNGKVSFNKMSYGGRAKFSCDEGFELIGFEVVHCTLNGTWSPSISAKCISLTQCQAETPIENGELIYASDLGTISSDLESYSIGTFIEIRCNPGFYSENDNLVTCTDTGFWDSPIESCVKLPTTDLPTTTEMQPLIVTPKQNNDDITFVKSFKNYLFYGCSPKRPRIASNLCKEYEPRFKDLSSFETPDAEEFQSMDSKIVYLLKKTVKSPELKNKTVESIFKFILYGNGVGNEKLSILMEDSFRFVICLYIDIMLSDEDFNLNTQFSIEQLNSMENMNEKLELLLRKVIHTIYLNHLKSGAVTAKPINGIQALLTSKSKETTT